MSKETASTIMKEPVAHKTKALYSVGNYKIDESIGYLLKLVRASLTNSIDRQIAERDISHDQWGILLLLAKGHGETAADLARVMACDTGSMTRMIDRLEAKGFVSRQRCEQDRRVVWLELTVAGREIARKVTSVVVDVLNQHLRGFSAEELETFKGFLRRMLVNREQ